MTPSPLGEGRGEGAFGLFTRREMRPVPDRIAQLPKPFEGGIFDDGFVEGHICYYTPWGQISLAIEKSFSPRD